MSAASTKTRTSKGKKTRNFKKAASLGDAVAIAVEDYFRHLEEEHTTDLYRLVQREVEVPLLRAVMERAHNNQSLASQILGLNRGTLRKKLMEHNLI